MSIDEAVNFLRRDAQDRAHSIYYAYVTDSEERLLGVVTFRDLLIAAGDKPVQDVMRTGRDNSPRTLGSNSNQRPIDPVQSADDPRRRLGKAHQERGN